MFDVMITFTMRSRMSLTLLCWGHEVRPCLYRVLLYLVYRFGREPQWPVPARSPVPGYTLPCSLECSSHLADIYCSPFLLFDFLRMFATHELQQTSNPCNSYLALHVLSS